VFALISSKTWCSAVCHVQRRFTFSAGDSIMSEKRPTDSAKIHFGIAQTHSRIAHQIAAKDQGDDGRYKSNVAVAINELSDGLNDLTIGLRATYILLEEVKRLLEQQKGRA
jgi:hypothetical protein